MFTNIVANLMKYSILGNYTMACHQIFPPYKYKPLDTINTHSYIIVIITHRVHHFDSLMFSSLPENTRQWNRNMFGLVENILPSKFVILSQNVVTKPKRVAGPTPRMVQSFVAWSTASQGCTLRYKSMPGAQSILDLCWLPMAPTSVKPKGA